MTVNLITEQAHLEAHVLGFAMMAARKVYLGKEECRKSEIVRRFLNDHEDIDTGKEPGNTNIHKIIHGQKPKREDVLPTLKAVSTLLDHYWNDIMADEETRHRLETSKLIPAIHSAIAKYVDQPKSISIHESDANSYKQKEDEPKRRSLSMSQPPAIYQIQMIYRHADEDPEHTELEQFPLLCEIVHIDYPNQRALLITSTGRVYTGEIVETSGIHSCISLLLRRPSEVVGENGSYVRCLQFIRQPAPHLLHAVMVKINDDRTTTTCCEAIMLRLQTADEHAPLRTEIDRLYSEHQDEQEFIPINSPAIEYLFNPRLHDTELQHKPNTHLHIPSAKAALIRRVIQPNNNPTRMRMKPAIRTYTAGDIKYFFEEMFRSQRDNEYVMMRKNFKNYGNGTTKAK